MTFWQRLKLALRLVFGPTNHPIGSFYLSRVLTMRESGKREIDIAQASEVVKLMPGILREYSPRQVAEWIHKD